MVQAVQVASFLQVSSSKLYMCFISPFYMPHDPLITSFYILYHNDVW